MACGYDFNYRGVTIAAGATLTIAPGVVLKFQTNCPDVNPANSGISGIVVDGSLVANGTPTQKIFLTALTDDTVGGDTNGDGAGSVPFPRFWYGIHLNPGASGSISQAVVRYTGRRTTRGEEWAINIATGNAAVNITDTAITDNSPVALRIVGAGTSPTISGNTFSRNSGTAVLVLGGAPTISGNSFDDNGTGISSSGAPSNITDNTFTTRQNQTAMIVDADFRGTLSGNTASGSGLNGIGVGSGILTANATWSQTTMPYVPLCGFGVNFRGVTVASGATLTIAPGVVLKFQTNCPDVNPANSGISGIVVDGSLVANGTPTQKIFLTALTDDTVGGDTNGDGAGSVPFPRFWYGIHFNPGASGSISQAVVRYTGRRTTRGEEWAINIASGNAAVSITDTAITDNSPVALRIVGAGTSPTIRGTTVSNNSIAVSVSGGATPHINFNNIVANSSFGLLNADCPSNVPCSTTPDIDAVNNFWGNPNGPSRDPDRPGLGDKVSFHVNFSPFQSQAITPPTGPAIPTGIGTFGQQITFSEPVSTGNGNYYYQRIDFTIPGRGLPLVFQRTYNSLDNYSGPLGANWTHSYNIILADNGSNIVIKWGDGHGETFTLSGASYVPQPGVVSTLFKNADGTFNLTQKNQTRYQFGSNGKLTSIQDRNGNTVTLAYNGAGNLNQVTDPAGRALVFSYDGNNRIIQITDPLARTVRFRYDAAGDLVESTDPAGGITTFTYDANHRVRTITQPNGQLLLDNTYDASGRVATQKNGRGFVTTFAYNTPNPGETTITDARGNATIHSYDASLRIVRITDAFGGITSYTYDASNNRTSVTNQNSKTTLFGYDARGNITSITDPLGNTVGFAYDTKNNLLGATNAKGKTTTFQYDLKGNLTRITDALANVTQFGYDGFGQLTSKTDATGNTTTYGYHSFGNLTRVTEPLGKVTNLAYDAIGRLTSITDPNGRTATAAYDALSRLTRITDPLGNQTQFAYDAIGNLLGITDANGNATSYAYDAANNLVSVTDALGRITRYAYDEDNNRTRFTNAKGNVTSYAYDALNRLIQITDPLSLTTHYVYDAVGNVRATTDAKGQTNQFSYDALNRLTAINYADGRNVTYSYDANGNRLTMVDSTGTTSYIYDDLDRVISLTHPGGRTVTYAYDAVGNRKSLTYPDGKTVSYTYDKLNRLFQVTDWLGRTTTYSYDAVSNLTQLLYPSQAGSSFVYDAANRLTKVNNFYRGSDDLVDPNPVTGFTYVLDKVGNRVQVADGAGKMTKYGYDALYHLTSVMVDDKVTAFTYDAVGNRLSLTAPGTSISYSYDAADRLLSAGSTTFTYDANGSHVAKTTGGTTVNYQYDAANRLIAVTGGGMNSAFAYDGDGNRVSQTVGTGTYTYVNDVATVLPVVLQESGPDGPISYAYGLGMISGTGSTFDHFYHYDGLGTVMGLTDPLGRLRGRYLYDAWGQALLEIPDGRIGRKNKYRFTGEALDPGTGLYYLRARYYDPSVARFLSGDRSATSALFPLAANRFVYAHNNPVALTDRSGMSPEQQTGFTGLSGMRASTLPSAGATPSPLALQDEPEITFERAILPPPEIAQVLERLGTIILKLYIRFTCPAFQCEILLLPTPGFVLPPAGQPQPTPAPA